MLSCSPLVYFSLSKGFGVRIYGNLCSKFWNFQKKNSGNAHNVLISEKMSDQRLIMSKVSSFSDVCTSFKTKNPNFLKNIMRPYPQCAPHSDITVQCKHALCIP